MSIFISLFIIVVFLYSLSNHLLSILMLLTDSNSYTNNSQVTNDILINTILFFFLYSIFFGIFFLKNWIFFLENSFSLDLESTCIFYYIFLLLFPFLPSFFSSSFSLCRIFTRFNNHLFKLISLQFPFKKKKRRRRSMASYFTSSPKHSLL